MEIIIDDLYEEIGAEFQYQVIQLLNTHLKKHSLDKTQRKTICGDFIFDLSMLIDKGTIESEDANYQLKIGFEKEQKVWMPEDSFEYHEYAFGNNDELFENE